MQKRATIMIKELEYLPTRLKDGNLVTRQLRGVMVSDGKKKKYLWSTSFLIHLEIFASDSPEL